MSLFIPAKPALKASPTGPGSSVLMTEFPLSSAFGKQSQQQKMRQAWKLGIEVPWIRAAELVIAGKIQALGWHIEDGDEETVDDDYAGTDAQELRTLIEKPMATLPVGQQMFRTALWRLTIRHIGLTGNSFWYLDGMNTFGNPNAILYIRPDRMSPNEDANGNLVSWQLDKTATDPGLTLSLEETIHFVFDPPDVGHFGIGLVESALLWAANSQGLDRHTSMLISAGGRMSGILSPKAGTMSIGADGGDISTQIERDWRTVVDQSDAAKRLQIVKGPVDFIKTTLTPGELELIALMTNLRDSLLALWHIPLTAIGIHERGSALSAGAAKVTETDDQTVWAHAVKARTEPFLENLQARLVDPYQAQGNSFTLILDYPTFDDNSQTYIDSQQALSQPITNNERRDILGLDPIDPLVIGISGGPLGDEVWMPATQVYAFTQAPGIKPPEPASATLAAPAPGEPMDSASLAAGETSTGKALVRDKPSRLHPKIAPLHAALVRLRDNIERAKTPILRRNVKQVLDEQKHEIAARLRKNADHLVKHPGDSAVWFPKTFDAKLTAALAPHLDVMASSVNAAISDVLPAKSQKAAPAGAVERVMTRGAARVTGINDTTKQKINEAIARALEAGSTIGDVADAVEEAGSIGGLDMGSLFDEYRAEMIARTELMDAYNSSAIASYSDAGITQVQAIDGDGDAECAERDGQIYDADEADSIEDHPNGTLDWVPVIDEPAEDTEGKAVIPRIDPADVLAFAHDHAAKANAALEHVSGMQLAQSAIEQVGAHARATSDLADAFRSRPPDIHNIAAPVVNVEQQIIPPPIVNVAATDMGPVVDAISGQTEALRPKPVVKTVSRDKNNRIASVTEMPLE